MYWSGVDYCDVLTLILTAPIHCRGSIDDVCEQVMWCCIAKKKKVQMKKLIYILDGFRVSKFSANFQFGVNYSFKIFGEKHLYF